MGRPRSGALPPPTARPLGGLPGPTTHWLWVRGGAGVGTRHQPHSARCGGGTRAPGWGTSCLGVGCPGSGALPPPTARPLGGLPGPTTHWLWVRGGAGVGTRHQPHSARSCVLWARHEGARGGGLLPGFGASGVGRSPTPDCPPFACACACPAWPGRAGRPPRRVVVRRTFPLAVLASLFACSAPSGLGLPCLWLLLGFFLYFCLFSPSPPRCAPVVSCFACFPAPGALGLGVLSPHFFFAPPPSHCLWRFLLPGCLGPMRPPPFFLFFVLLLFFLLRVCCVCSGVSCCVFPVLPVCCAVRAVCAVSGGWCFWFLVSLPFVGSLLVALVARRCRLVVCVGSGARVWSGRRWASSLWCPVPLCCVLWRCAAVWCCAVVPCLLFLFFSLLVAPVSCCSPLVLGSGPVLGRCCFCALPVRCCAGVPAPLLSVRCSLALAGLAGVVCCCLLCLCVCCWAWLSSVVSWWVLVAPGVVSRWRAVVCPWVPCCDVLLRVLPPGVALLCAVLFRFAPFGASARCVVSWGAVRRLGVLCLLAPCFVLSCVCFAVVCRRVVLFAVVLCAACALGCRVVRFLSSPPCAVLLCVPLSLGALLPCAVSRGAVLPRGAVVSCPAALLGLFLALVWLYLLEKPLQNFVKIFFSLFLLAFEKKLYTTQHTRVQQDHVRCCALRATRRSCCSWPCSCAWRRGAYWCPLLRVDRVPPGPPPELQGKRSDGHEGGEGGAWRRRRKRRQGTT